MTAKYPFFRPQRGRSKHRILLSATSFNGYLKETNKRKRQPPDVSYLVYLVNLS